MLFTDVDGLAADATKGVQKPYSSLSSSLPLNKQVGFSTNVEDESKKSFQVEEKELQGRSEQMLSHLNTIYEKRKREKRIKDAATRRYVKKDDSDTTDWIQDLQRYADSEHHTLSEFYDEKTIKTIMDKTKKDSTIIDDKEDEIKVGDNSNKNTTKYLDYDNKWHLKKTRRSSKTKTYSSKNIDAKKYRKLFDDKKKRISDANKLDEREQQAASKTTHDNIIMTTLIDFAPIINKNEDGFYWHEESENDFKLHNLKDSFLTFAGFSPCWLEIDNQVCSYELDEYLRYVHKERTDYTSVALACHDKIDHRFQIYERFRIGNSFDDGVKCTFINLILNSGIHFA